jgi:hypothetical protein
MHWWALEHLATFYDTGRDHVRVVPVFAAEVAWTDRVDLSHEHDRYAFVSLAEARRRVLWATQRQAIVALRDEVLSGLAGSTAREVTARMPAQATRKSGRGGSARRKPRATTSRARTSATRRTRRAKTKT